MSKVFRKKYLKYLAGIGGKDDKGKARVREVEHSTSAPVVYISNKWGGKWKRIDTWDIQSISLRSASSGEDTCVVKYRYGYIAYPNAPGKQWRAVTTKRFTGKTMWVRVMEDKLILFQGVLTNVDDEFYGRGRDNNANTPCGVQTFTFKGGLYLLGRFRFYKSFWHSEGGEADELDNPEDRIVEWIPDFGGESPEYSRLDKADMEIQKVALGNILIYEQEVKGKKKKFVAFGGTQLYRPEGSFAYLSKLVDLDKWSGPVFDVDLRYIKDELAGKQIEAEPVMNAREFLLKAFDVNSGYDFYFEPTKKGYTIVPFPRENNDTYFWINPQHTAVVSCTLSRNMEDYYTAVRVVGERIVCNVTMTGKPTPVRNPVGVNVNDKDENGALCMFDWFINRQAYNSFILEKFDIDKDGEVTFDWNDFFNPFIQTKYREVLTDFYYDENGKELKENVPRLWLDGRAYNRAHGGDGGNDNDILWTEAHNLEVGVEPFKQAIGFKLKVKHWTRLLDGFLYGFGLDNGNTVVTEGDNNDSEDYSTNWHRDSVGVPIEVRKFEVPDICMGKAKFHFAFESDQRFQYVFGDYQDEYRTLTVYEKDARLVLYYDLVQNDIMLPAPKAVRNDFYKLKKRYEAILQEYRYPPSELTCQIKGVLSPAVLGKKITVAGDNVSQNTETSLTHISYTFPEGKPPQTRI